MRRGSGRNRGIDVTPGVEGPDGICCAKLRGLIPSEEPSVIVFSAIRVDFAKNVRASEGLRVRLKTPIRELFA
jgi:hypothetical protein